MMINSTLQLNEFMEKNRVKNTAAIIPMLVEKKELITPQVAKLILKKTAAV